MSTMSDTLFPSNPTHGMIFEQKNGVMYQYDTTIKAWLKIATDTLKMNMATVDRNGAMAASDLRKLNRLLLSPPVASIIGNNCVAPYRSGNIALRSTDDFVTVTGSAVSQNIDYKGDMVSETTPYQIHQHTYGFDFGINMSNLMLELTRRNQLNLAGRTGEPGDQGDQGDPGINGILSGPQGDKGDSGPAIVGNIVTQPESILSQIKNGLKRALVNARLVTDKTDERLYSIEFDRQVVGAENAMTSRFIPKQIDSTWVLAAITTNTGDTVKKTSTIGCGSPSGAGTSNSQGAYDLYYIDIAPIVETIKNKYSDEIKRLKYGYEQIYKYWLNKMSDMYDEQKSALCCALEKCMSMTKNIDSRKHMESVGAALVGKGRMQLHGRDSSESVALSSTRGLRTAGGPDLCFSGPVFPQPSQDRVPVAVSSASPESPTAIAVQVDPIAHSASSSMQSVELPAGKYSAIITKAMASISGHHRSNVRIQHIDNGEIKTTEFLDKGSYGSLEDAQDAYEGLNIEFHHDGGYIGLYLPSLLPTNAAGFVELQIHPIVDVVPTNEPKEPEKVQAAAVSPTPERFSQTKILDRSIKLHCAMDVNHLRWYELGWAENRGCGLVVNISGQDYIIFKRGINNDDACGGGESLSTPCIESVIDKIGHPAFAWPTFDGRTFAPLPKSQSVRFVYDPELSDILRLKIGQHEYNNVVGREGSSNQLMFILQNVMFPVI